MAQREPLQLMLFNESRESEQEPPPPIEPKLVSRSSEEHRRWTGLDPRRSSRKRLQIFNQEYANELRELEANPMPKTFGECVERQLSTENKPCLYLRCKYNALSAVNPKTGSLRISFAAKNRRDGVPDIDLDSIDPARTCVPMAAQRNGGMTLEEVGSMFGLTRERIRQIETRTIARIQRDEPSSTATTELEERPVSLEALKLFLED